MIILKIMTLKVNVNRCCLATKTSAKQSDNKDIKIIKTERKELCIIFQGL